MNQTSEHSNVNPVNPPRLWPLWIILTIQAMTLIITVVPSLTMGMRFGFMMLGPLSCFVMFTIWALFFGRLNGREKLTVTLGLVFLGVGFGLLVHPMVPVAVFIYGLPLAMAVCGLVFYLRREKTRRVTWLLAGMAAVFALFLLIRLDGFTGDYHPELAWRWSELPGAKQGAMNAADTQEETAWDWQTVEQLWPGFRGVDGDSRVPNLALDANWETKPPQEVWRIEVGPAWSSFAAVGDRLFTQEQWGESEGVACYDAATGERLWQFMLPVRFDEVVSGSGPRATPTFADGRIFALGAMGNLIALDARSGESLWQRDLMAEFEGKLPVWGFSSSPLVIDDVVIVHAGGSGDNGLMAFRADRGEIVWTIPTQGMNFGSAQAVTLSDRQLAVFTDSTGLIALEPASGKEVWRHKPSGWEGLPIVQSQQIGPNSLVIPLGDGMGLARVDITFEDGSWNIEDKWSSRGLKPAFNDYLYHDGFLYGFDRNIFSCISAETGERQWKGGRYGFGQALVMSASGHILVLTEKGSVVLLAADPKGHQELATVPAVISGKTWNHPAMSGENFIVRNGKEAVALRLPKINTM